VIGLILFRTKSLVCKDALHRDSTIQKYFRDSTLVTSQKNRFPVSRPDAHLSIVPSVRTMCHTVRTPDRPSIIRPDDVYFYPDPSLHREASIPACIRPDVSAARPDASQYSTKLQILSKFIYGKIDATVQATWIPVWTRFSLRQESQFKFNRLDASLPSSGRACI